MPAHITAIVQHAHDIYGVIRNHNSGDTILNYPQFRGHYTTIPGTLYNSGDTILNYPQPQRAQFILNYSDTSANPQTPSP